MSPSKDYLIEHYSVQKKTMKQIGDEIGLSSSSIASYIKKFEIPKNPRIPPNLHNLVDREFEQLTVKRRDSSKHRKATWICECSCGKEKSISSRQLLSGKATSCGKCSKTGKRNPAWLGHEELTGIHVGHIRRNAESRGLKYNLEPEFLWELFLAQDRKCALSGVILTLGVDKTASLDRIDSSRGYEQDNVQWVHKSINKMKMELSQDEFISWCCLVSNQYLEKS